MEKLLAVLALLINVLHCSEAFGSGAPARACAGLQPLHNGVSAQPSTAPYNFSISSMYYTPGTPLTVTITGSQFGGFILQARMMSATTAVGTFTVTDSASTKNLQCQAAGDTITHTSTSPKNNLQLMWMPPSSNVGTIVFRGSVAQSRESWWGTLSSAPVMYRAPGGGNMPTSNMPNQNPAPTTVPGNRNGGVEQVQVSLLLTSLAAAVALVSRLF